MQANHGETSHFRFVNQNERNDEPVPSTSKGITSSVAAKSDPKPAGAKSKDATEGANKQAEKPDIVFLTGTVERIIKWHKIYDQFCFYELIAAVISIQEGTVPQQKIMLLRDRKGPIMQVIYYESDRIEIEMDDFQIDQMLRCVGIMIGNNIFRAFKIRIATNEEIATLQRFCYISDHTVTMLTNKK